MDKKKSADSMKIFNQLKKAEIPLDVLLCSQRVEIGRLANLAPGSVLLFDVKKGQPAQLRVQGVPFAEGEVVQVNDHYGLKVETIHPSADA